MYLDLLAGRATSGLAAVVAVILVFVCSSRWYKNRRRNQLLAKIPSAWELPGIGNSLPFLVSSNPQEAFERMSKSIKHDGLFRFSLFSENYVVMNKPEYLKVFYLGRHIDRSDFYEPINDTIGDSIFTVGGAKWKHTRKLLTTHFFGLPPPLFLATFQRHARQMVRDLTVVAKEGREFLMLENLQETAGYALMERGTGDTMSAALKNMVSTDMCYLMKVIYWRVFSPICFFKPIFDRLPLAAEFYKKRDNARNLILDMILKQKKDIQEKLSRKEKVPLTLLSSIAESQAEHTTEDLVSNFMLLIPAGIDTSTETMGFTLTMLGIHPDVEEKVFQEDKLIHERLGGREPTIDDMAEYVYLEMVFKETLRIFSCGPLIGRTLREDTYFGDYLVPSETNVVAMQQTVNLDPTIFNDPMKFDPERFSPENADKIPPYAYNPFSNGPRGCPGMKYAYLSMKTVVTHIVRNFTIHPKYQDMDEVQANVVVEMTLRDKNSFPMRLQPRNKE